MIDDTLGVVLAGGRSRRFGSDKSQASWADETLLERAVRTLGAVFSDVVIAGPDPVLGRSTIPDTIPGAGPLAALVSALEESDGRSVFMLAVDLPLVTPPVVSSIAVPTVLPHQVRVARAGDRLQPLCGAYGCEVVDLARKRLASGRPSVKSVLKRVRMLSFVDVDEFVLTNVNRPKDMEAARRFDGDAT